MSEINPRDILGHKAGELILEIFEAADEYMPDSNTFKGKVLHYVNLCEYMIKTSKEEMARDHLYETVYAKKCPITYTDEQIDSGEASMALEHVCMFVDCPMYDSCWAAISIEAPVSIDRGLYP